jgi:hypothetical protein
MSISETLISGEDFFDYIKNEAMFNFRENKNIEYADFPEDYTRYPNKYDFYFVDERHHNIGMFDTYNRDYLFNAVNAYFENLNRNELSDLDKQYNISFKVKLYKEYYERKSEDEPENNFKTEYNCLKINVYVWREKDEC